MWCFGLCWVIGTVKSWLCSVPPVPQALAASDQRARGPGECPVRDGHGAAALPQPGDGHGAQPGPRGPGGPLHPLHPLRMGQQHRQHHQRGHHGQELLRAAPIGITTCHEVGTYALSISHLAFRSSQIEDIPAQWAEIIQGLDIFRISSKCLPCMSTEWRSLRKFDRSVFTQLKSKVGKKCRSSYGSYEKWR